MIITKRDNRWYDENNNSWRTEESATQLSPTLTNCRWCRDCSYCDDCSYCGDCRSCKSCNNVSMLNNKQQFHPRHNPYITVSLIVVIVVIVEIVRVVIM